MVTLRVLISCSLLLLIEVCAKNSDAAPSNLNPSQGFSVVAVASSQNAINAEDGMHTAQIIELREDTYEGRYYTLTNEGTLARRRGRFIADVGTMLVPENHRDLATRMIELSITRIRATGDNPLEPIFWLGGGPGQSNMKTFKYDYFISRHDHVMVGYRGVDGSVSLDCPEVARVLKSVKDVLTDASLAKVGDAYAACAARLQQEGVDINGYTALEVVDDIEDAREALGYEKIDIIAESYGTRVAYLYALKYPQSVHRMVLIGANPPGRMVWDPYQADALLKRYGELWTQDAAASARCPDLVEAIRRVNQNMPRRWLFFPIHPGNVRAAAFAALIGNRESAALVFDTYCAAANEDPSGLWLTSFLSKYIFPSIVNWGDNASKAASADYDPSRDYAREMVPPNAIMGAPLGRFLWAPAARWPIQPIPQEYRQPQSSAVETLILSGNLDFSTPAENATNDLLPHLSKGRQIIMKEMGYVGDIWRLQPQATHRVVTSFLDTGIADDSLVTYQPMDFRVQRGFPLLAKLIVAGVSIGTVLLGLLVLWLINTIL
ncbi:alpha/beta hydrolase [Candidatus Acetothermia bacterium]|jgi:pimeloyl-ACP methyl ester carboxylesterase|nr:alpha/beta hydrolase [Candidatus Acetothermia bacterium]MCI2430938.1 alpha/beta hydrolase [Candidatus Acetothermia bacterium]MCI2437040.1 alpha/beta hydrolase [Candidatus Acetothermia bacterium]